MEAYKNYFNAFLFNMFLPKHQLESNVGDTGAKDGSDKTGNDANQQEKYTESSTFS